VKPIDVRIIEHDGFIDYEIEFVELSEEQLDEYTDDFFIETEQNYTDTSGKPQDATVDVTTQKIATTLPFSTSTELTAVTFVDLLRRARRKYRRKVSMEKQRNSEETSPFNFVTTESIGLAKSESKPSSINPTVQQTSTEKAKTIFQRRNRKRNEDLSSSRNMAKQRKRISQFRPDILSNVATIKLAQRFKKTGRSTTPATVQVQSSTTSNLNIRHENQHNETNEATKNLAQVQALTETPVDIILSSTAMPSYQEHQGSGQTKDQVNDSSLKRPTENISGMVVTSKMTEAIHQTTEHPGLEITTTLSLIEELKRQLITISYDLSQEQSTDGENNPSTTQKADTVLDPIYDFDDLQISESRSVINLHTSDKTDTTIEQIVQTENPVENITASIDDVVTEITISDEENVPDIAYTETPDDSLSVTATAPDTEYGTVQTVATEKPNVQPERSPKRINGKGDISQIIENSTSLKGLKESLPLSPDDVVKGLYHEMSPGQYHETHPGQYHEVNPGQYHESNPGQYHESNPGQYDEKHPGHDLGVDNLTVDFDHTAESRVYNVKANAGDFIIGEVGRIDINSGQTSEGVRYTAVEGEVDPGTISDLLAKYFGTRTS